MSINSEIQKKLKQGDLFFEKTASQTELKVLRGYKTALNRIQEKLSDLFIEYNDKPTLTELRKFNRLAKLEKQLTEVISDMQKETINTVSNSIKTVVGEGFKNTLTAFEVIPNFGIDFDKIPKDALDFIYSNNLWTDRVKNTNAQLLVDVKSEVERTLRENVREEIGSGLTEGKSYKQVSKAIQERFNVSAGRANRITYDQMHAGHMEQRNLGIENALDIAKESGIKAKKVWRHYPMASKKPREDHASMDGKEADEDGNFHLPSGAVGQAPGLTDNVADNVNCHCGLVFEVEL